MDEAQVVWLRTAAVAARYLASGNSSRMEGLRAFPGAQKLTEWAVTLSTDLPSLKKVVDALETIEKSRDLDIDSWLQSLETGTRELLQEGANAAPKEGRGFEAGTPPHDRSQPGQSGAPRENASGVAHIAIGPWPAAATQETLDSGQKPGYVDPVASGKPTITTRVEPER